jgi:hypothetical protein
LRRCSNERTVHFDRKLGHLAGRRAGAAELEMPVPGTVPDMTEPRPSVSMLPMPLNRIAALPPLMVPAWKTEEPSFR